MGRYGGARFGPAIATVRRSRVVKVRLEVDDGAVRLAAASRSDARERVGSRAAATHEIAEHSQHQLSSTEPERADVQGCAHGTSEGQCRHIERHDEGQPDEWQSDAPEVGSGDDGCRPAEAHDPESVSSLEYG